MNWPNHACLIYTADTLILLESSLLLPQKNPPRVMSIFVILSFSISIFFFQYLLFLFYLSYLAILPMLYFLYLSLIFLMHVSIQVSNPVTLFLLKYLFVFLNINLVGLSIMLFFFTCCIIHLPYYIIVDVSVPILPFLQFHVFSHS